MAMVRWWRLPALLMRWIALWRYNVPPARPPIFPVAADTVLRVLWLLLRLSLDVTDLSVAYTNGIVSFSPKLCYNVDISFREGAMRVRLASILSLLLALQAEAGPCRIVWPNAEIAIPALVRNFIVSECIRYKGTSEESLDDCITAESYGYRAVVTILVDALMGDKAAERYRACAAGLGDFGGKFHRRKAECIGGSLGLVWRFEFSART